MIPFCNAAKKSKTLVSYFSSAAATIQHSDCLPLAQEFASYLEFCPDVNFLKKVHASAITHGLDRNIFLGSKLVNSLSNFNLLAESSWVFNRIINDNLSLWNSVLVGHFRAYQYGEVLGVYSELRQKRIGIHSSAITFALKSCLELGDSKSGRNIHADAFRFGLSSDRFVCSTLIDFYNKCDQIGEAAKVFDEMTDRDVVAYTSLITGYSRVDDYFANEAFTVAGEMQMDGFEPNRVTLLGLLRCAARLQALDVGRSIHGYAIVRGIGCEDEVFETSLIDMYVKCGDPYLGAIVLENMSRLNTGSCNALMAGYIRSGRPLQAFDVFKTMVYECELDLIAFANALLSCADSGNLLIGKAIHGYIIRGEIKLDLVSTTALIDMYAKCKHISEAMHVFFNAEVKDTAMSNVMIAGYLHNGCVDRAIEEFRELVTSRVRPSIGTIISILSALSGTEYVHTGSCIHGYVFKQGLDSHIDIANQLINMYGKCGSIVSAKQVFDLIEDKDTISWTSMMTALINNGRAYKAVNLFLHFERENLQPDAITYTCLLQALNQLRSLILIREVHGRMYRTFLEKDTTLMNSLMTTYSKQGKLRDSINLFNHMPEKHVSSWNTMIAAYGMHGDFTEAINLFYKMREQNVDLDGVTFLSVLSACSHTGRTEEGIIIFSSMEKDHGIIPSDEHYGCLIDLLCRAGKLRVAYNILELVPERQNAATLGSLLAACRVHRNSEIGESVGQWLLEIEPENPSVYCSLSNFYAEEGRWDEVARIGALAESKGLKRTIGFSLVGSA